jgi:hypothetical protein
MSKKVKNLAFNAALEQRISEGIFYKDAPAAQPKCNNK